CPDSAILRKGNKVEVNYDYCKGCGICANECPTKAINMEKEEV
ncbi:MAG: 4Fe-4S binding protein, partial [Thermoproteota archaeon]